MDLLYQISFYKYKSRYDKNQIVFSVFILSFSEIARLKLYSLLGKFSFTSVVSQLISCIDHSFLTILNVVRFGFYDIIHMNTFVPDIQI